MTSLAEKHYSSTHNSSKNPIKKSLQPHFYKEWNMKRIHLIEDAEILMEEGQAQPFMKSKSQVKNVQDQARSV